MAWVDKPGVCEICGKPIVLKSSRQKYCEKCGAYIKKHRKREREYERRRAKRQGLDPDACKGKDHECLVKESCIYGSRDSCMYIVIEGHSRILAGYPIRGGKCDLYKRGKKKPAKPGLPKSSPVLRIDKVREI